MWQIYDSVLANYRSNYGTKELAKLLINSYSYDFIDKIYDDKDITPYFKLKIMFYLGYLMSNKQIQERLIKYVRKSHKNYKDYYFPTIYCGYICASLVDIFYNGIIGLVLSYLLSIIGINNIFYSIVMFMVYISICINMYEIYATYNTIKNLNSKYSFYTLFMRSISIAILFKN